MVSPDVFAYYALGREERRLSAGIGRLEALQTAELLGRWLPPATAVVLDVGGAAGRYALPLAADNYDVHLLDPVPLHVQHAHDASATADRPLASIQLGDARELPFADESADVVLLLGPLYHSTERADRQAALREAHRVLRPGGVAVIAAISRWASMMDGFARGFLREPEFAAIVASDVATGVHRNPDARPGWFATAYFHRPDELVEEVEAADLVPDGPVAVEGVAAMAPDIDAVLTTRTCETAPCRPCAVPNENLPSSAPAATCSSADGRRHTRLVERSPTGRCSGGAGRPGHLPGAPDRHGPG